MLGIRATYRILTRGHVLHLRSFSSVSPKQKQLKSMDEVAEYLSKPSWSVQALLPTDEQIQNSREVTIEQLQRLLRLTALPAPRTTGDELRWLRELKSQLHFVKQIQQVNTDEVEPLKTLRGESTAFQADAEVTLATLKEALAQEQVIGTHHKRIGRRKVAKPPPAGVEGWDVLGQASNKVGKFFVVNATGS